MWENFSWYGRDYKSNPIQYPVQLSFEDNDPKKDIL